jgi:hypothetical protein
MGSVKLITEEAPRASCQQRTPHLLRHTAEEGEAILTQLSACLTLQEARKRGC